jgi:hypothetical protein
MLDPYVKSGVGLLKELKLKLKRRDVDMAQGSPDGPRVQPGF